MRNFKSVVIKIGSNILANSTGVDEARVKAIANAVAELKMTVPGVIIVSSGAIAAGFRLLGYKSRPKETTDKQACAAAGQSKLMWHYDAAFGAHGIPVAQILVTKNDFSNRSRYLYIRNTIDKLLSLGAVPIINENDSVSATELKYVENFGDNDNLSAVVASQINADLLLILSDVDGLYTADPSINKEAKLISTVSELTPEIIKLAGGSSSALGTGGMASKLSAAQKALSAGCHVCIMNGKDPQNILRFMQGKDVGTFFDKPAKNGKSKKLWLSYATIPTGSLTVDDGAMHAITAKHSSLLASGITAVNGNFKEGDVVNILGSNGYVLASGKVRYSAADLNKIKGLRSDDACKVLGKKCSSAVVHCDEMGII